MKIDKQNLSYSFTYCKLFSTHLIFCLRSHKKKNTNYLSVSLKLYFELYPMLPWESKPNQEQCTIVTNAPNPQQQWARFCPQYCTKYQTQHLDECRTFTQESCSCTVESMNAYITLHCSCLVSDDYCA